MKIPFTLDAWLKDKSQKVETRDGRLVHNIWQVKDPSYTNNRKIEVCALIDGEEDALVFFEGGRYLPTTKDTDSPFDLFIITPELELSEFEHHLCEFADYVQTLVWNHQEQALTNEQIIKGWDKELLELAIDEIGHKWVIRQESYRDGYINGLHDGKAEALKDLPRWRKLPDGIMKRVRLMDKAIIVNHHYILFSDLEKLSGFKED